MNTIRIEINVEGVELNLETVKKLFIVTQIFVATIIKEL